MVDGKSAEREMRRGAMMTERRKRGTSSLREEVVVEHGRRGGACARRRRSRLRQKRQHSSGCIFPLPVTRSPRRPRRRRSLSVEFLAGGRRQSALDGVGAVTKCRDARAGVVVSVRTGARRSATYT